MPSITRSTSATSRQRRSAAIERVLAAVNVLLEDGERFTELPVARIAEQSGIARSTFYQYFPSKSHLLIQVADLASRGAFAAAATWFSTPDALQGGSTKVHTAISTMLAEFRKHRTVMRALGEVAAYDDEVGQFWLSRIDEFIDVAEAGISTWQERGEARRNIDPRLTASALTWMVERTVFQHVQHPTDPPASDNELVAAIAQVIWTSITPDAP